MTEFKRNDIVRFKGDNVNYRVACVNAAGDYDRNELTYEIHEVDTPATFCLDFIPARLLELAPPALQRGDIVETAEGDYYIANGDGRFCEAVHELIGNDFYYNVTDLDLPLTVIGKVVIEKN